MEKSGALSDGNDAIPLVIRDAILATTELGLRYLWVDCICIQQDNESDVRSQIGSMDIIYSHAALTIVAAAGDNADDGLSGVRSRRRMMPQYTACIQGLHLIGSQNKDHYSQISDSTWATRGWTFQEKALSKRILYFTESQAAYKCQVTTYCEDAILETDYRRIPVEVHQDLQHEPRLTKGCFEKFFRYAKDYTGRELTYESDVLDAFKGAMNLLEPRVGEFFWGHPMDGFDDSLLWRRSEGRRLETAPRSFPS
ncbi:uncharacterized protein K452DRAFT_313050 [Aplosporella prunicola CBS 121167]|uniref:Heterokaryon incompatibility domain-containing protein n=1 Tax=Aplosporella prunicola CBS 121167 TaxID=1176127 RepID=A0A6A6B065_9PEZI|nr:uncharacterized protein K452DRAFT_313050 [Aplosporella prunicola CBS 121167]KAF2136615.1 hypothetical protein K452DRAFT_313050 [Aplosporella prunicola CBS 121167]